MRSVTHALPRLSRQIQPKSDASRYEPGTIPRQPKSRPERSGGLLGRQHLILHTPIAVDPYANHELTNPKRASLEHNSHAPSKIRAAMTRIAKQCARKVLKHGISDGSLWPIRYSNSVPITLIAKINVAHENGATLKKPLSAATYYCSR